MGKRINLTEKQYRELVESRDWCATHGLTGLKDWYDQELAFQASRRVLPPDAREYRNQQDEDTQVYRR